jgi:hypothetical protein
MILLDCFEAFLRLRSIADSLSVFGDLISYVTPFIQTSAVFIR